ncbi:MAG TPA: HAD-IA family hydrolase [Caldisericia bacterium]|nr:HAD-IA family hydrolase [Caldisericia bacterium]HPF48762.1 HAD-IA family hydrolase [Caldisericia bacterium]HPI83578.1 HAD-IA family hydrolase [Caldisericia bacterium]HPQ93217.1 HAD-IA family hydrolase [Caldisericia bacterium]HRV74950.1 HAD-IA family hydrolase [Caldisericia bacterium]
MKIPIIDCDQTLYINPRLMETYRDRIREYLFKVLNMPKEDCLRLQRSYWEQYGTTLAGLIRHNDVDPLHYLEYIHDVDITNYVYPNPALAKKLGELKRGFVVMSNAPRKHVVEVLDRIGIAFSDNDIFGIEDYNYNGKPFENSYRHVLTVRNIKPQEGVMFDDDPKNLEGARRVGLSTCLVGRANTTNGFDYSIDDMMDMDIAINE